MPYVVDSTELIGIIGAVIAGITAIFLWYQIRQQTNIQSAVFSMDFLEKTQEKYKDTIAKIRQKAESPTSITYDDKEIRLLLNHFEYMAGLENDGLIKIKHIDEMFGQALLRIYRDTEINTIIDNARKNDTTIYYNIISLIDKIQRRH
jgi:hypothetical protein